MIRVEISRKEYSFKYSFTICGVIFGFTNINNNVSHSVNYIPLLGKWYINPSKINKRIRILTEFINLLKEKLDSLKLICTLNEREYIICRKFDLSFKLLQSVSMNANALCNYLTLTRYN